MPITLYHVSFNVDEPLYKKFIPRIPDNTINEEDTETARVCFRSDIGVRPVRPAKVTSPSRRKSCTKRE